MHLGRYPIRLGNNDSGVTKQSGKGLRPAPLIHYNGIYVYTCLDVVSCICTSTTVSHTYQKQMNFQHMPFVGT